MSGGLTPYSELDSEVNFFLKNHIIVFKIHDTQKSKYVPAMKDVFT